MIIRYFILMGFALALQLSRALDDKHMNALLLIPQQLDRFILLPKGENRSELHFVRLETLLSLFIERTFPGYKVLGRAYSASFATAILRSRKRPKTLYSFLKAL